MTHQADARVLTTTRPEVPNRRIRAVLGVVSGEGDTLLAACSAIEEMALDCEADAVIDVRTIAVAVGDGVHRAQIRWGAIGTAVRLEAGQEPE